jgi:hypothetical protein
MHQGAAAGSFARALPAGSGSLSVFGGSGGAFPPANLCLCTSLAAFIQALSISLVIPRHGTKVSANEAKHTNKSLILIW